MSDVTLPRDVRPMQIDDGLNHRKLQNKTGAPLTVGQLVAVESMNVSEAFLSAQLAFADGTWRQGNLYIVGNAIQESGSERRDKFGGRTFMVMTLDTSLAVKGDPVYLSGSTPGAVTLAVPANVRQVGQVLIVGAEGKVLIAPKDYQNASNPPFVLDQKWRDEFNADWESPAGAVEIYVDNIAGSDTTGDGSVVSPYASLEKAELTVPHHRNDMAKDTVTITLVNNGPGNPYAWGGQNLVGSLDLITIRGQVETGSAALLDQFTPGGASVSRTNGTIEIDEVLAGTLNDQYKGAWLYIGQAGFDFTDPDNYAHVSASSYLGGGLHKLYVSDKRPAGTWTVPLTLFDSNPLLTHVNLRPGAFVPGEKSSRIYDSANLRLQNLYLQNLTQVRLQGNDPVIFDGCFAETMAWFFDGGSARLIRTYIRNSTAVPTHGSLDLANGASVEFQDGNTLDGTNVVVPNAALTTGTLASLWLHSGSHVHVSGGLWLRSHAHIVIDKGAFHRSDGGAITVVLAVQQGGPGYTIPGYVMARLDALKAEPGSYPAGEVGLFGPVLPNFGYVIAAVGHDIALADDGDLLSTQGAATRAWLSADGGVSKCSYDPGKGTRVRINDDAGPVGMFEIVPVSAGGTTETADVNWARGEDLQLDLDAQGAAITDTTLIFVHPRLGGTHKLWVRGRNGNGSSTLSWPANVVWAAGAPVPAPQNVYQLYVFEYLPATDKYYARHAEVNVA